MLLRQADMENRFTDLDEQEQRERLNEDMEPGLGLEYAFGMGDETSDSSAEDAGISESFVIGEAGTEKPFVTGNARKPESREKKPPVDREDKAVDSISYRLFHWKFTVEQKEGNGCPCAKGGHTVVFLSGNFCCADDGDTQEV